jgi:hypothetical protein
MSVKIGRLGGWGSTKLADRRDFGVAKPGGIAKMPRPERGEVVADRAIAHLEPRSTDHDTSTDSLGIDRRLGRLAAGLGLEPRPRHGRGLPLSVRGPPGLELLRPPADARGGRVDRPGPGRRGGLAAGASPGVHRAVRGVDLADGETWLEVLRPLGRGPRRVRPERLGLPHGRGRRVRPARRPAPVLLAPDPRSARIGVRRPRADLALGRGRPGLGLRPPEQVPRGLPAGRGLPLYLARTLGTWRWRSGSRSSRR